LALDTLDKLTAPMPAPPVRQFSFTDFATNNPTTPPPGDRLDAEFDRANAAITDTIDWASVSLNTDGSIRDGAIGENNLQPDLFDDIASDAIAQVQPLVDQAAGYAGAAASSASAASGSATTASAQAVIANGAANSASIAKTAAETARDASQGYATTAQGAATDAGNAENEATGAANLAQDYAVVTQAWAEHMPDPIPPNILAVMGITGDHWSSRWWANRAAAAFGELASLYLGAFPVPPTNTATGGAIPTGAIYYNTTSQQPFVWTGSEWQPFYAPTKSLMLTLSYLATAGQTTFNLSTPDRNGQSFVVNPNDPEPLDVYLNGARLPRDAPVNGTGKWDFDPSTNTLTFLTPLAANDGVLIDVLAPASSIAPSRVQTQAIEDLPVDGTVTTFPLFLVGHTPLQVGSAQELFVSLDGVPQKPGTDYNVASGSITFGEAPLAGSRAWGLWYGPGTTQSGGAAYLPLLGGVMQGPITLYAAPAQPMEAANKGYVDNNFLRTSGGLTLPTSPLGLPSGAIWSNGGVLCVAP